MQTYRCPLYQHNPDLYSPPKYRNCGNLFHTLPVLRRHVKTHAPPYYCTICHYRNASKKRFQDHYDKGQCKPEENKLRHSQMSDEQQRNYSKMGVKAISWQTMKNACLPCSDERCDKCWPGIRVTNENLVEAEKTPMEIDYQGSEPEALVKPLLQVPTPQGIQPFNQDPQIPHAADQTLIRDSPIAPVPILQISRAPAPTLDASKAIYYTPRALIGSTSSLGQNGGTVTNQTPHPVPMLTLTIPGEDYPWNSCNAEASGTGLELGLYGAPVSFEPVNEAITDWFQGLANADAPAYGPDTDDQAISPRTVPLPATLFSKFNGDSSRSDVSGSSVVSLCFRASSSDSSSPAGGLSPRSNGESRRPSIEMCQSKVSGRPRSKSDLSASRSHGSTHIFGQFLLPSDRPTARERPPWETCDSPKNSFNDPAADRRPRGSRYRCPIVECPETFSHKYDLCTHMGKHGFRITVTKGGTNQPFVVPPAC